MSRGFLFTILYFASVIPSVLGSAKLVPKTSTASCTGHLSDLILTSITCDHSNSGCTYGSEVFVTGQVTSNADLPRPLKISVSRTFPSIYGIGTQVSSSEVYDLCSSDAISLVDDNSGSSCPVAGVYNFNFLFDNFGTSKSWYAGWHGFSMGMAVHLKHEGGGSDFATCTLNVSVEGSDETSYATNATLVSFATLGLAGLCVGMFSKKRKERLFKCGESIEDERTKELATNFELVRDSTGAMV